MYKAVGTPGSRLTRVTWMLEELGEPYEIVKARPGDEVITALNPSGRVPALIDTDFTLTDSAAICSYLADRHPEEHLSALSGTRERARIESWLFFAQSELEAPVWRKAQNRFVLPEHLRADVADVTAYEFDRAVEAMSKRLADQHFAIGERFTIADILLGHICAWAAKANFAVGPVNVVAYVDRVCSRPALAKAREREAAA